MNHLFPMAMLLLMLAPQNQKNQNLPAEFYQIPEQIREQATVIISGTYAQGRTPCMFRPDGSRVWFLESWFAVKKVYRGEVNTKSIRINKAMLPKNGYVSERLEWDHNYLVLLRPGIGKMKRIKTGEERSYWDALRDPLRDQEIIAIVELKRRRV